MLAIRSTSDEQPCLHLGQAITEVQNLWRSRVNLGWRYDLTREKALNCTGTAIAVPISENLHHIILKKGMWVWDGRVKWDHLVRSLAQHVRIGPLPRFPSPTSEPAGCWSVAEESWVRSHVYMYYNAIDICEFHIDQVRTLRLCDRKRRTMTGHTDAVPNGIFWIRTGQIGVQEQGCYKKKSRLHLRAPEMATQVNVPTHSNLRVYWSALKCQPKRPNMFFVNE